MFGFPTLAVQLLQGSAHRTWNCVTKITNLLWYKFNHTLAPTMPRSRRRHHSRSRSRSHSHDRDREPKRRKIDAVDSPNPKRSVSCDATTEKPVADVVDMSVEEVATDTPDVEDDTRSSESSDTETDSAPVKPESNKSETTNKSESNEKETNSDKEAEQSTETQDSNVKKDQQGNIIDKIKDESKITPKKAITPKQLQKKLESEKKRKERELEREKKLEEKRKALEEKRRQKQEQEEAKQKERNEKNEQKAKERELKEEQKRKEKEEKEQKRKEREEREEQRRKEREQEKLRKQQEIEDKNKEKQKQEEKKQKAAAVFANFFVTKKASGSALSGSTVAEEKKNENFMPFEVKSDMRLPPNRRAAMTSEEKEELIKLIKNQSDASYLQDLKSGKIVGKSFETWPYEDSADDCVIIEEDFGESICEDKEKPRKMRAKFLKFRENRRPPYFGTWRKKSSLVTARKPFGEDKQHFDYEVDSDDDWEEEEQGESVGGSEDEKENEPEDDYEVDNEFFVPHGHLSDDEIDDEANAKLSPESLKQKLKLLKDEFDEDMKTKTHKIKPRSIGCIWYNKDGSNVDESIDRHLKPLAMITNGIVLIKKRSEFALALPTGKIKELPEKMLPHFLKMIHLSERSCKNIVDDFLIYIQTNNLGDESKINLKRNLKKYAKWKKCTDEGPMLNKYCWNINEDILQQIDFSK